MNGHCKEVPRLEHLPFDFAEQYKWLCLRASQAAARTARGEVAEAASAALAALVHNFAISKAECVGLAAETRELLQQLVWSAVPSLTTENAKDGHSEMLTSLRASKDLAPALQEHIIEMVQASAEYALRMPSGRSLGDSSAWSSLVRFVYASWRCCWRREPWRGVNLGGWLLLEPGPSYTLWDAEVAEDEDENACSAGDDAKRDSEEAKRDSEEANQENGDNDEDDDWCEEDEEEEIECEHSLCSHLGTRRNQVLESYREDWLTEKDFEWLRSRGFNSVRIPFGYWIVTGPTRGDPFVGPALHHLDRAVALAEKFAFQVVLDLHANPGGESGDAPSGRKNSEWTCSDWRQQEALEVLRIVSRRYAGYSCVAGIQVANEPSMRCDMVALCNWYEQAIDVIRGSGMHAGQVAIVLPVYWYDRLEEFVRVWVPRENFLRYPNIALDLHLYHCFGRGWEMLDHREHVRVAQRHGKILQSFPGAVIGEWSMERPAHVLATDQMETEFADAQLEAYACATHGWFFWTYSDQHDNWDIETCFDRGWLRLGLSLSEASPDVGSAGTLSEARARIPPPGAFPEIYGPTEFSQLPAVLDQNDEAVRDDVRERAKALAAATGRPETEAREALHCCDGDNEQALSRLLSAVELELTAQQLAEVTGRSAHDAFAALRTHGGDEALAACALLEPRGQKRARDANE